MRQLTYETIDPRTNTLRVALRIRTRRMDPPDVLLPGPYVVSGTSVQEAKPRVNTAQPYNPGPRF